MLMAMARMQKWLSQIERGDVKYACCNVAKVEGPISIRRMNEQCMTFVFPGEEGVCGPLSPLPRVLPAIALFLHQAFAPLGLVQVFLGMTPGILLDANLRWLAWAPAGLGGDRPQSKGPRKGPDIEDRAADSMLGQG